MWYYYIYKITCTVNGKIYIGKHKGKSLTDYYLGSGRDLIADQIKYGKDKFKKEVICICKDYHDMNRKEKELVTQEFVNRPDTYNLVKGGGGSSDLDQAQMYKIWQPVYSYYLNHDAQETIACFNLDIEKSGLVRYFRDYIPEFKPCQSKRQAYLVKLRLMYEFFEDHGYNFKLTAQQFNYQSRLSSLRCAFTKDIPEYRTCPVFKKNQSGPRKPRTGFSTPSSGQDS